MSRGLRCTRTVVVASGVCGVDLGGILYNGDAKCWCRVCGLDRRGLFDQLDERVSGSILELYLFEQGTFFARQVNIPNLYESILIDSEVPDPSPFDDALPDITYMRPQSFLTIDRVVRIQ